MSEPTPEHEPQPKRHDDALSKRTELLGKPFQDLADLPEDDRIEKIGNWALARPGQSVAAFVDDIPGKPQRYIRKLRAKFGDRIVIEGPFMGPSAGICTIRVKAAEQPGEKS